MSESVVLVTGTSTGIGVEIAVGAAKAGSTVVATMRNLAKADVLRAAAAEAGVELDIRRLDVTDAGSIEECVAGIVADHGRIDTVVNNAGSGHLGTIELESVDDVREVMEVNFFGVVAVTHAVMPQLRASKGRLVTVTSIGGVIGQPFNEAYCAAKFAVEGFMEGLAPTAATVGVRVSVVEPGPVLSEFVANVGIDREAAVAAAGPYLPALAAYVKRTEANFASSNAQSPAEAAAPILELLAAEEPVFRIQTSEWTTGVASGKLKDLDGSAVQSITRTWVGLA